MKSRATTIETARRVNTALSLLQRCEASEVVVELMARYGLSRRQAYRYVREAQDRSEPVAIPERKSVFTVKLPASLIAGVRRRARDAGKSISDVVAEALWALLGEGSGRGRSEERTSD